MPTDPTFVSFGTGDIFNSRNYNVKYHVLCQFLQISLANGMALLVF